MSDQATSQGSGVAARSGSGEIVLDRVGKTYGGGAGTVQAIQSITLTLEQGQSVAIVGPSGCGKSTLMRLIAGLDRVTSGTIHIGGTLVSAPVQDLGVVFQRDLLLDWRSVVDNVLLPAEIKKMDMAAARKRAIALLEELGVAAFADHYPWQLSGGMRQRVAIARALLPSPPLMFMDEPFSALDAMTRDQMNVLLQQVQAAEHVTTLLITHSILEAVFVADRVLVMSGRPGAILDDILVDFPRPRKLSLRETPEFAAIVRRIREQFVKTGDLVG